MSYPEPDLIAEAWRLQSEGIDATNAGRPNDGADILRAGLGLLGWIEDSPFERDQESRRVAARLLISLAYAEAERGQGPYGLTLLEAADSLVAPEDAGLLANQRGIILRGCGRVIEALQWYDKAEPLLVQYGLESQLVRVLLNRGQSNNDLGRFREAREDHRRCAELAQRLNLPEWLAKALHAQGITERGLGDVPAALAYFAKAEALYESTTPDMIPQLEFSRATALREAGLRHDAATHLDTAIRDLEPLGRVASMLASEVHRARLAVEMGNLETAIYLATRAQSRADDQGTPELSDWAERTRREAEFRLGRMGDEFAEETLALAWRLRESNQDDVAELAELLAARVLIKMVKLDEAQRILVARPRTTGAQWLTANTTRHLARAELSRAEGDRSAAMAHLRDGLTGLHKHRQRFGSLELQAGVSSLGAELADMGLALALESGRPATVFSWSERSRAQAYRLPSVRPPEDSEAADLVARVRELHAYIAQAKKERRPVSRELGESAELENRLRERDWQISGPRRSIPEIRPRQVHEALDKSGQALVSFIHHDGQLHALTMSSGRTRLHPLGSMAEAEETVRKLVADLDVLTGRRLPETMANAVRSSIQHRTNHLDTLLFADLRLRLGDRDLVVVPTGALTSLPWGLLPTLKARPVTVAPSASAWWQAHHQPESDGHTLLASGPDLMYAGAELDSISKHYRGPKVLRGAAATPTAILAKLDGARIAHLAAHGRHEPDNVLFSRLEFSGGPLMAYDIARLRTPPAHVTLSACDVGQSEVSIGDETLGFTAALLAAGTRTVVSCVAKVEHAAAADIMTAYHAKLVEDLPPARALAEASQLHPFSPFVCYGAS